MRQPNFGPFRAHICRLTGRGAIRGRRKDKLRDYYLAFFFVAVVFTKFPAGVRKNPGLDFSPHGEICGLFGRRRRDHSDLRCALMSLRRRFLRRLHRDLAPRRRAEDPAWMHLVVPRTRVCEFRRGLVTHRRATYYVFWFIEFVVQAPCLTLR